MSESTASTWDDDIVSNVSIAVFQCGVDGDALYMFANKKSCEIIIYVHFTYCAENRCGTGAFEFFRDWRHMMHERYLITYDAAWL